MPEPNEKMDALLKASAKRRQEEAGAPLELHPATRTMLQAEVSRSYPETHERKKSDASLFSILWPRLIFGGAFLAALVAAFFLVLSPKSGRVELTQKGRPSQAKEDSLLELRETSDGAFAKNLPAPSRQLDSKKEEPSAVPPPAALLAGDSAAIKLSLSKKVAESAANGQSIDRIGDKSKKTLSSETEPQNGGELLAQSGTARRLPERLTKKELLADAPVDAFKANPGAPGNAKSEPVPTVSGALGQTVSTNRVLALAMKRKSETAPSAAPAPAPVSENNRAAGASSRSDPTALYYSLALAPTNQDELKILSRAGELKAPPGGGGRFVQVDSRARFRRNFQSPPIPKVLTAFNLERDGNKIRITDTDGSVYDGEIEPASGRTPQLAPAQKPTLNSGLGLGGGSQISTGETVAFRVSGINKTLQQSLVFAGVMESAQLPKSPERGFREAGIRDESAARKKDLDASTFGLRISNPGVFIRGKASIGGIHEFPLEAVHENP